MATARKITDFMMRGTHAARPVTPTVGAGEIVIYFETDTLNSFIWTGAAWAQMNGTAGKPAPSVVRSAGGTDTGATVAMGGAPVKGNILVALGTHFTNTINPNFGWGYIQIDNGASNDGTLCAIKFVRSGDTASQTPFGTSSTGVVAVFEVQNCIGMDVYAQQHDVTASNTITQAITTTLLNGLGLCLFATANNNLNLPTSRSIYTQDGTATGGNRAISWGHFSTPTTALYSPSATWAAPAAVATVAIALV